MAWLEITIDTASSEVEAVAQGLTARGFSELVIEDQQEFEEFLEENRAYWDYIDEKFQQQLQGLSRIKLYLEDTDEGSLSTLRGFAPDVGLPLTVSALEEPNSEERGHDNQPPQ